MSNGRIVVFSGFSGVGKNTIINELRKRNPSLLYIPSMTTRKIRNGESNGKPYYFVSIEEFEERIKNNYFIEYEPVHNNFYGTPKDKYEEALQQGRVIVKDIDVNGAVRLKEEFGEKVILVFIEPPNIEELKNRLIHRGDNKIDIKKRLERIDLEMSLKSIFDEVVINDDLEKAVIECETLIQRYLI